VLQKLPADTQTQVLGKAFFPTMISDPFEQGLRVAFAISAVLSVCAALASLMRGKRYIHDETSPTPQLQRAGGRIVEGVNYEE